MAARRISVFESMADGSVARGLTKLGLLQSPPADALAESKQEPVREGGAEAVEGNDEDEVSRAKRRKTSETNL